MNLNNKNYYKLSTNYLSKNITLHCYKVNKLEENIAVFSVIDYDKLEFKIKTTANNISSIVHELKHMDFALRGKGREDKFFRLRHSGRYTTKSLKHLLDDGSMSVLDMIFYCVNDDEFQAQYHDMYYDLKKEISDNMTNDEIRKNIDEFLNRKKVYILYSIIYKYGVDIRAFFKSKRDLYYWLDSLRKRMEYIDKEGDDYYIKKSEIYLNKIKFFINKFRKDIEQSSDNEKFIDKINYMMNLHVKNNFKKFSRLYALFLK